MSVTHTLLGLLEPGPQHGYTLKHAYDTRIGRGKPLRFGQVYATLARLERDGFAEVVSVESGEGPERKRYAITGGGVSEFESWLRTPETPDVRAIGALFAKTVLALQSGRSAAEVLDAQRTVHIARMRDVRSAAAAGNLLDRLGADFEIAHLEADLRWIETAAARLDELAAAAVEGRTEASQ